MLAAAERIVPDWPAPPRVHTWVTTRCGGVSEGRYASFNLATHCGDAPERVAENRTRLVSISGAPSICWLDQVHGVAVVDAGPNVTSPPTADAALCRSSARACAILTADCLPVLICDRAGTLVAAAHCGWRGLAHGVLTNLVARLATRNDTLLAWLGPAIGPTHYEIGNDVRDALFDTVPAAIVDSAVRPGHGPGKWWADLYALARAELAGLGVTRVYGGGLCTYGDTRFYSFRRDGVTGRMATLIWLADGP
jgi:hypothetical protein